MRMAKEQFLATAKALEGYTCVKLPNGQVDESYESVLTCPVHPGF